MAKFSRAFDWTEVIMLMSAMESMHECRVACRITAPTDGHNGVLTMQMVATFVRLPGSAECLAQLTEGEWPNKKGQEVAALAYDLLFRLDYLIVADYSQKKLPGA